MPLVLFKAFPLLIVATGCFQKRLTIQASVFGIHASLLKILPKMGRAVVFRMLQKVASDTFSQHLGPCEAFVIWFYMVLLCFYATKDRHHVGSQGPRPCLRPSRKQMRWDSDRQIAQAPYMASSSKAARHLHPLGRCNAACCVISATRKREVQPACLTVSYEATATSSCTPAGGFHGFPAGATSAGLGHCCFPHCCFLPWPGRFAVAFCFLRARFFPAIFKQWGAKNTSGTL